MASFKSAALCTLVALGGFSVIGCDDMMHKNDNGGMNSGSMSSGTGSGSMSGGMGSGTMGGGTMGNNGTMGAGGMGNTGTMSGGMNGGGMSH